MQYSHRVPLHLLNRWWWKWASRPRWGTAQAQSAASAQRVVANEPFWDQCGLRRSREGDALELGVDFSSNINYLSCILLSSRILSLGTLSSLISCLFPILCALIYRYFRGVPSMISWRSFGIFSIMIPCRHFLAHLQNAGGWAMFCWFGDPFFSLQALSLPHGGAGPC